MACGTGHFHLKTTGVLHLFNKGNSKKLILWLNSRIIWMLMRSICYLTIIALFITSCGKESDVTLLQIRQTARESEVAAKKIENEIPIQLAQGLNIKLWASDSLAPDPIAMSIDDNGNIFLTSTERQKNSEFDIRGHENWMIPSISFESVEDRRAFLRKTFAPEKSFENTWLKDLNNDNVHDWKDLTIEKDEVWKLEDENSDGRADISTRIVQDFNEEISDVAEGLLVRERDMFIGIGPDLWRLEDKDKDGIPETKESISHGYAVHIGFSGHGMSGIVEGPDGKIYWGIGDIGANLTAKDGTKHFYPNEGIIVRSNPDGSDFEVVASGLRNTHEFVFDALGNIITSDNDGDHAGESERLLHIVEGADIGWRANWQYGKYTDPKNNNYNVWMDEKFFIPRWEGQAAHLMPPIMNYHNGPTGMVYNPGTALGTAWVNRFFLVEFTGTTARSHIWSFSLKPSGASFVLKDEIDMLSGLLPTGIKFGPDGALYIADWITGWGTKDYGRVWKLDVNDDSNDLSVERELTKKYIQQDYTKIPSNQLAELIGYKDMRVRQKAQFELAQRGETGFNLLVQAAKKNQSLYGRIHGIWGIGQMARNDKALAKPLVELLSDKDFEVVAQAAKTIGDIRYAEAGNNLINLLGHVSLRVRFFAAQSLGRIAFKASESPLITLLDENADKDLYLRHAAVLALSRLGYSDKMVELAQSSKRHLRIAAVLVLRRLKSEKISAFLNDPDEYIITETARAIHDDRSITKLLPDLAQLLAKTSLKSEPLLRRCISAAQRVGTEKELALLIAFANRKDISSTLRAEAMATLGTWAEPSVVDRVDGYYRGAVHRDPNPIRAKLSIPIENWLNENDPIVLTAVSKMIRELSIKSFNTRLATLARSHPSDQVRVAILQVLNDLEYENITELTQAGLKDRSEKVRTTAIGMLSNLSLDKERLKLIVRPILSKGTLREQQQLIRVLGKMDPKQSDAVLSVIIDRVKNRKMSAGVMLELSEAIDSTHSTTLQSKFNQFKSDDDGTLIGGSAEAGAGSFYWDSKLQCVRCHAIGTDGGKVGPSLTEIGDVLSREQIREALINPSARIAPGYGTINLKLTDGSAISGTLMAESSEKITLKTENAEPLEIDISRIRERTNAPSGMPAMGLIMSKQELRNMVEFLSTRKRVAQAP
jgi:quinoprotein glucose dehydrogenase